MNYYTGSFPIDFKNAKLESFEAIDEEGDNSFSIYLFLIRYSTCKRTS